MKNILKLLQGFDNLITYIFSNLSNENVYLKNFFKSKKINFVDVGANLGGYTNLIIKNLNINEIHIFEPSNECFFELKKKFKKKKVFFNKKALSNKNKISSFYENEILSQSSLHKDKNKFNSNLKNTNIYKVKCTTLNNYFKKRKKNFKIDLLKIDAEGEDLRILEGASKLLQKKKIKLIKIELLNSLNKKNDKSNINQIIILLNKYGYYIDTISKTKFVNQKLLMMDVYFCVKRK